MSAEKLPPERRPPASAADAAARLARIVDAAERAASSVIDDAEAQARHHLEQAQSRADRIVAERLRELADQLDPLGSDGRPGGHLKPAEDEVEEGAEDEERQKSGDGRSAPRRAGSAGARLLATQMAVSGADRGEIEARLRSGFEIEDTGEILDAILGPEE